MTNKKETFLKILSICTCVKCTIDLLQGKADFITTHVLFVIYSLIILFIITKVVRKLYENKIYRQYIRGIKYLKDLHKRRYEQYFSDDKVKLEEYSAELKGYGKAMLDAGNYYVRYSTYGKKRTKRIKEILEETKLIMTTEQPLN